MVHGGKNMKKIISIMLLTVTMTSVLVGCKNTQVQLKEEDLQGENITEENVTNENVPVDYLDFNFEVIPETFQLQVESGEVKELVSEPLTEMQVSNLSETDNKITWTYDDKSITVEIEKQENYLDVTIKSNKEEENMFSWPKVSGQEYMLPINEGKLIPSNDALWKEYFNESEIKGIEGLSMQFFAVNKSDYSLVYIIKNPYNNEITFDTKENIEFTFNHEYPTITPDKQYGFRIYVTKKNPVDVAKTYKNYMVEKGEFKTLEEKAKDNSNIEKLYGAPHVYFWDKSVISEEDIVWNELKANFPEDLKAWIQELLITKIEDGKELSSAFDDIKNQDFIDKYTKNRIIKSFTAVLQLDEFYNEEVFVSLDQSIIEIMNQGIDNLNPVELIDLNKRLLKSKLGDAVGPVEDWANANTVDILEDMKNSGLDTMWLGLDDWQEAYIKPELVEKANELGYLIGTYDSYHSIHKPGEEQWTTAKFEDTSLYENATVTKKNGEKIEGFQGQGRKLNPVLAMPSVKERVSTILNTGVKFNSWFLDTDGTGEVFDDYSPDHITTEAEDIKARIQRMEYLQQEWDLVVGTEGGNDFANQYVAFAHGIETPSFSWMDQDMNKNKESEYYVGRYYSSYNGVPEMFSKQIPLKDKYKQLFLDTTYTMPLYKLVYNDSVITTHWWGWGTLKFEDEIENRMLYEVLYNVPPLYHIDRYEWEKHKEVIVSHTKVWSDFSKKVINKEMTNFEVLSEDKLVQMTEYGNQIKVIANFSNDEVDVEGNIVAAKSLVIIDGNEASAHKVQYTP